MGLISDSWMNYQTYTHVHTVQPPLLNRLTTAIVIHLPVFNEDNVHMHVRIHTHTQVHAYTYTHTHGRHSCIHLAICEMRIFQQINNQKSREL